MANVCVLCSCIFHGVQGDTGTKNHPRTSNSENLHGKDFYRQRIPGFAVPEGSCRNTVAEASGAMDGFDRLGESSLKPVQSDSSSSLQSSDEVGVAKPLCLGCAKSAASFVHKPCGRVRFATVALRGSSPHETSRNQSREDA
ncbi:unnamed protein product [Symbiodinium sp. KB8]|nr:unnamed protein product [Symbiodinium sp. KB8]